MALRLPIGVDDFRKLRERGLEYIDKSHFIRELLDHEGVEVLLLPRPRRFGKTLNLSMLRWFFEARQEELSRLFSDLRIWQAGDAYRAHFQRYPVLSITFKGTRAETFEACWAAVREKIEALFREHASVLEGGTLSAEEAQDYRAILAGTAGRELYGRALLDLSRHLHRSSGREVILLIDEYDEPIHAGYLHGYAPQIIGFCRTLLIEGLKGNPHLFKAVVTGILRVARESIFSGLNNVAVYTVLATEFNTCFGFTEPEVESLLTRTGAADLLEGVRAWYNGYSFGGQVIYNPWSILSFLDREDKLLRGYWITTSANDLIRDLLQHHAMSLEEDFTALMAGGRVERRLEESVALSDLRESEHALWSLLVLSGYLRAEPAAGVPGEEPPYLLSIPNREVREVYTSTFRRWMEERLKRGGGSLRALTSALLHGDAAAFEHELQPFVANVLSHHDVGGPAPERVYQGFVLGLLAALEPEYEVRSNREQGHGRADVVVRPRQPGKPGAVLELKVVRPARGKQAQVLGAALAQIDARGYAAELCAAGAAPVHAFAVAFDGKRVWVRAEVAPRDSAPRRRAAMTKKARGKA